MHAYLPEVGYRVLQWTLSGYVFGVSWVDVHLYIHTHVHTHIGEHFDLTEDRYHRASLTM